MKNDLTIYIISYVLYLAAPQQPKNAMQKMIRPRPIKNDGMEKNLSSRKCW